MEPPLGHLGSSPPLTLHRFTPIRNKLPPSNEAIQMRVLKFILGYLYLLLVLGLLDIEAFRIIFGLANIY